MFAFTATSAPVRPAVTGLTWLTRAARTHVVEVALTRDEAAGGQPAMLPARVGPRGILRLESAPLSARDRVRLDSTLAR